MKVQEIAEKKLAQFRSSQKLAKKVKELEEELSIFTEGMRDPLRAAYRRAAQLNRELSQTQLQDILKLNQEGLGRPELPPDPNDFNKSFGGERGSLSL